MNEQNDIVWKFQCITSHQGPLTTGHSECKASTYIVNKEWDIGEITSEPLKLIAKDDPVACKVFAEDIGLLDNPGWKDFS
jgi:hypothetical protein